MAAFVLVDTAIDNADEYERYKALAKPIAEKYGGVYRARGGTMDVRETDLWTPTRMVIIEFPDMAAARAFVDSLSNVLDKGSYYPPEFGNDLINEYNLHGDIKDTIRRLFNESDVKEEWKYLFDSPQDDT